MFLKVVVILIVLRGVRLSIKTKKWQAEVNTKREA